MCQREYDNMVSECEHAPRSSACQSATGAYLRCMMGILAARDAHSAEWDERMYLLAKELEAAWTKVIGVLDVPPRPDCGLRSAEVRAQIFSDRKAAMLFSQSLQEAFRKGGISLADDETFLCSVCVAKKPRLVSDALALDPLGQRRAGGPRINYVMEPAVMDRVLRSIEQEEIDYKPAR